MCVIRCEQERERCFWLLGPGLSKLLTWLRGLTPAEGSQLRILSGGRRLSLACQTGQLLRHLSPSPHASHFTPDLLRQLPAQLLKIPFLVLSSPQTLYRKPWWRGAA